MMAAHVARVKHVISITEIPPQMNNSRGKREGRREGGREGRRFRSIGHICMICSLGTKNTLVALMA